ncbi:MAG: hypothetical protein K1X56_00055 [Flavobacteriales bacterium]|nr:hypothetical protein [Flavobacteriales bacterium]
MNRVSILFLFIISVFVYSCEKGPGKGGKAKINVTCINGLSNMPYAQLKIKYGASSYPGQNVSYDENATCDYTGDYTFDNLKRGDYYVYAYTTDSTGNVALEGGAHVLINNKPGETHVVVDFSEADPF